MVGSCFIKPLARKLKCNRGPWRLRPKTHMYRVKDPLLRLPGRVAGAGRFWGHPRHWKGRPSMSGSFRARIIVSADSRISASGRWKGRR